MILLPFWVSVLVRCLGQVESEVGVQVESVDLFSRCISPTLKRCIIGGKLNKVDQ